MLDYVDLDELLARIQAGASAPDCHGFLCGQICISGMPVEELWQEFMDIQSEDDDLVYESCSQIKQLVADITGQLQSPDLEFQLLMPDEETPIGERLNALADWCHGFLNGFGLGIKDNESALSDECRELLNDFTRICRVEITDNADNERNLLELTEYVRIGAINIFEESFPGIYSELSPGVLH